MKSNHTWKGDSRVQTFWKISCSDYDNTFRLLEPIQLYKQLIQRLLQVLLISVTAFTTNSIQLINKDDGRLFLPSSGKEISDSLSADTNKHLFEIGSIR